MTFEARDLLLHFSFESTVGPCDTFRPIEGVYKTRILLNSTGVSHRPQPDVQRYLFMLHLKGNSRISVFKLNSEQKRCCVLCLFSNITVVWKRWFKIAPKMWSYDILWSKTHFHGGSISWPVENIAYSDVEMISSYNAFPVHFEHRTDNLSSNFSYENVSYAHNSSSSSRWQIMLTPVYPVNEALHSRSASLNY